MEQNLHKEADNTQMHHEPTWSVPDCQELLVLYTQLRNMMVIYIVDSLTWFVTCLGTVFLFYIIIGIICTTFLGFNNSTRSKKIFIYI